MEQAGKSVSDVRNRGVSRPPIGGAEFSIEHYLRMILHRKWIVLGTFVIVTGITAAIAWRMPDLYMSSTVILVDPQKVPESYVRSTVTGDVRNRLGTLEQQILSATRLQKIIDSFNLYPEERRKMAREDVITRMTKDISISLMSNFGATQDLQAFRISYSGRDPRLVAQVATELAGLFIEENLKAREQQATGTTEFLENQLQDTRKNLEAQEAKLRDFRMKHIGEMPEQQAADLQILGQLQSQLQLEGEALSRAEQQKSLTQSMAAQSTPVIDLDDGPVGRAQTPGGEGPAVPRPASRITPKATLEAALKEKLSRGYTEAHPDIKKLRLQIADEEAKEAKNSALAEIKPVQPKEAEPKKETPLVASEQPENPVRVSRPPVSANPILVSQLKALDAEIAKHRQEQQRLNKAVANYQAKLEAIPVREQEISQLVRDYEISKAHYGQLLEKQLSAETATQLEIRQKGEKFSILDPAQPAQKPSKPNRMLIDGAGACAGLALGLLLALATEFLGISITAPDQLMEATGVTVVEVIPVIRTRKDQVIRKRRLIWGAVSCVLITVIASCSILYLHYRT